jgi:putative tricarboxylic transport membrane protein
MKALLIEVACVLALGAFSISEGIRLVLGAKLHKYDIIGPGFYSIGMGAVLIIAALTYFLSEHKKAVKIEGETAVEPSAEQSGYMKKMMAMIAVMIVYLILMTLIGYLLATFVFFLLINRIAGFRSWLTAFGVTVLMTACFYLIFVVGMGILFPRGLLFDF